MRHDTYRIELLLGYACSLLLMALAGWSPYKLLEESLPSNVVLSLRLYQSFLFAATFLGFVAYGVRTRKWPFVTLMNGCTAIFLLGVLSFSLARFLPDGNLGFALVAATCFPFGRAGFLALSVSLISTRYNDDPGRNLVLTWIASSLLLVLLTNLFKSAIATIGIIALMVVLNATLMWRCARTMPTIGASPPDRAFALKPFLMDAWPLMLFGCLLAFCSEIVNRMAFPGEIDGLGIPPGMLTSLCKVASAILLLVIWKRLGSERFGDMKTLGRVFPTLYLVVITCCLPLPFFSGSFAFVSNVVTAIVAAALTILMTIACIKEGQAQSTEAATPFCLFAGLFYFGMASGDLIGLSSAQLAEPTAPLYYAVSFGCVYVLSLGFLLFNRISSRRGQIHGTQAAAASANADDATDAASAGIERSAELADEYKLSSRERDVLEYLVQGRDAAFIAQQLFITENTVRSHIKKIYQKMDIHSRQELFDLVYDRK